MNKLDLIIRNGQLFDGTGDDRIKGDIGILDGVIVQLGGSIESDAKAVMDATGHWVMPGFIDFHTHYDAELEIDPSLSESVRHGVTSVVVGSCSLSTAVGEPEDIADIFCRVEGVPRSTMLPLLEKIKTWTTFEDYLEHLAERPLGPNVSAFVGHSNLRMNVMGFARSLDHKIRPTQSELKEMKRQLERALDAGYLGLSIQTLPWDKLDGDRFRSRPLPSYYARWSEYRQLTRILRRRKRVFQGVPNITTKVNVLLFLWESVGLFRPALRTTVISLMDIIANRSIYRVVPWLSRFFNRLLGADFRFQALPNPFDVWADGMELVIFEEFASGTEAIHLNNLAQRAELLQDPEYIKRFRRHWKSLFSPRVYHRNLKHTEILDCPDKTLIGRSFFDIAKSQGQDPVAVFLNLASQHGERLRWYSMVANDRLKPLERIVSHPDVLIGFSDAGAHLRNMAHYSFPLRMLKLVRDAELRGEGFMSIERAVHRLTGEIADWFRLPNGHLKVGQQADLVVVNPDGLNTKLDETYEIEMPGFSGLKRLVRRSDDAVPLVVINGKTAWEKGALSADLGKKPGFGRVLKPI
ncbi:MAG: N-acyl-D-glutamate amidohydrolase [Myxococcales bacterium]|nr:N-acyl-D-glutamate amidohydrolase [Myxococcales bacterium]|tara:strand:- start:1576 stop:3315 length:1740 start_codon:yes stop_codon:yes gene_type:complete